MKGTNIQWSNYNLSRGEIKKKWIYWIRGFDYTISGLQWPNCKWSFPSQNGVISKNIVHLLHFINQIGNRRLACPTMCFHYYSNGRANTFHLWRPHDTLWLYKSQIKAMTGSMEQKDRGTKRKLEDEDAKEGGNPMKRKNQRTRTGNNIERNITGKRRRTRHRLKEQERKKSGEIKSKN